MKTDALIAELSKIHPKGYDLSLGRISGLLERLGNPQDQLPPIFHVAGTNGKGSVVANLRAILEASNLQTHSHTSPHLVGYHERFRLAEPRQDTPIAKSSFVSDARLADALGRVADANAGAQITLFELLTATMFVLFSEHEADYAIVEVGLGGRFDGTNVIANPRATIITTISLDHQTHLGDTIGKIAFEKAGIIKPGCPVVIGPQTDEALSVLEDNAAQMKCPTMIAGQDFIFYHEAGRFIYQDEDGLLDLPMPKLLGEHQLANSATAIAATRLAKCGIDEDGFETAMENIYWPGRMERLMPGAITRQFDQQTEIWVDGGHNGDAGKAIAAELGKLSSKVAMKLTMICAMLNTKDPKSYFSHFAPLQPKIITVPISNSEHGIAASMLAEIASQAGLDAVACDDLDNAFSLAAQQANSHRLLFSGSLYLVGEILEKNGTPPT